MKNIKILIPFFVATVFLMATINAQVGVTSNRDVVFIHGLNDVNGWDNFSNFLTNTRRMNSDEPNHNSQGGFGTLASNIFSPNFGNQSLVIGHSLGGSIARRLNRIGRPMGGIITVGSPLEGAPIANALLDGSAANAVQDAIFHLSRGPLADLGFINPLITVGGHAVGAVFLPDIIDDALNIDDFGGAVTLNDIKVGGLGTTQDKFATFTPTPKVSIWGNEVSPVHWNLLSSSTQQDVVEIADDLSTFYETSFWVHTGIAAINFWNPAGWWSAFAAHEWHAGWAWIDDDSERIWNNLIGSDLVAQHCWVEEVTYCYFVDVICEGEFGNLRAFVR
ncbi:MAG: hypothetical protein HC817_12620 [Saprospiraceae bacterium]|nr:hypothetical protein [Saprospiraceae bacterium]